MIKLSASTHPAKGHLIDYVNELTSYNVDMIHCDVMDGNFVKDIALNVKDISRINNTSTIILDVHLMVQKPYNQIKRYAKAGADIITVHYEAFKNTRKLIKALLKIKSYNLIAGLSINPNTELEKIAPLLKYLDLVLIMSVKPGKSGQKFLKKSLDKIEALKKKIANQKLHCLIEVDGGINESNINQVANAGANIAVVGSNLYNSKNREEQINILKKASNN